jgi:hypothetical protein
MWELPESEDAQAAGEMLGAAWIDYDIILPSSERLDMGAPRVAVLSADVARVRKILS